MSTKVCSVCDLDKDIWEFAFRSKKRGTRRTECKDCQRIVTKEHYKRHKSSYTQRNKLRRDSYRAELNALKEGQPCVDCNGVFHPCQMDYDHLIPETKVASVSTLMNNFYRSAALQEIEKCELVCANCHRMRTWQRANS